MDSTFTPKTDLQAVLDEREFWLEIRKGLLIICTALSRKYPKLKGITVLFGK